MVFRQVNEVIRREPRRELLRQVHWPRALPDGALLVRDVGGDLYRSPEPGSLDQKSGALLWAFVD